MSLTHGYKDCNEIVVVLLILYMMHYGQINADEIATFIWGFAIQAN